MGLKVKKQGKQNMELETKQKISDKERWVRYMSSLMMFTDLTIESGSE